ncbi:MAG TPA: 3-hydroxyacyl-CoA dehydrogenase NAD-binding domain-containing protein, partial [Candidatus Limnocylindria bacterium]|nr:3-hydroxyacyl-CoA dehydrogenase NAD-binding domain-containing protein [Candidatus Limnocylindria bacterium]
ASGVARIVIDRPDDPVNAIDVKLLEDLAAAIAAAKDAHPRGLVVASGKDGQFMAGADLSLLRSASQADAERASRAIQQVLNELAALPFTTVAAINGPALGGGLELALACDFRIVADAPNARVGLTETRLGLIPAAGGTQRLPRLVGLPRALDMILAARQLSPKRALRAGVVDEVVHPAVLLRAATDHALRDGKRKPTGGASAVERAATWVAPARAFALRQARSRTLAETKGRYPAPIGALDAVATGLAKGMTAGLDAEARAFGELAAGDTGRNLTALVMLTLRQRKAAFDGLGTPRPIANAGVVGLGFMGSGIAQAMAAAGTRVRARDRDPAAVAKGLSIIRELTTDATKKGVFERREAARIIGRISGGPDLAGFRNADLVIEAVFEEIATKRRVVAELEQVLRPDAVIASNTSALPISEIAREARSPERIVGMHFFSPVHKMPLVEIVRPARADPDAVATAVAAANALGKTPIVVNDGPGFYTTRVLSTMIAEAFAMLAEGDAMEAIDRAMTDFGWPVGPLQLVDEVGLEVAAHAGETVARARGIAAPTIVNALVAEGFKGKHKGGGFYRYDGRRRTPNPRVRELLGAPTHPAGGNIAERLTLTFVNEAARCLDQGVLRSPAEGDLGAVLGLGFPPFLGGPFRYADAERQRIVTTLERLAAARGDRLAPTESLRSRRAFFSP